MSEPRLAVWKSRALRLWLAAGTPVVGALGSVARNKWLALHLDPAGLGVLGQVVAGQTWLGTLTGLGLAVPVARSIGAALARDDAEAVRRTFATARRMIGVTTLVAAALGLAFAPWASLALFGTAEHAGLVRISMLAVVGLGHQALLNGLFAGHSDVKTPFTYAVAGAVVMVGAALLLVPRFAIGGAVWSVSLFWPAAIAVSLLVHGGRYRAAFARPAGPSFDPAEARAMLGVAMASLALGLADLGTLLVLRSHYVRIAGLAANGLLQASLGLSQQLGSLIYAYLSAYAFGRISGQRDVAGVRHYTRLNWTPLVGLGALGCLATGLLATPLLHLLYSSRFDAAGPMLAWMLAGEFGKIGVQVWALGALPVGGVRLWVPIGVSSVLGTLAGYAAAAHAGAGVLALPLAYAAGAGVSMLVTGVLMSARGVTLRPRDLALWLAGAALLVALAISKSR